MQNWSTLPIAALLLLGWSASASAQMVLGPGVVSCGTWTSERNEDRPTSRLTEAWVLGFVSAFTVYGPQPSDDISKGTDANSLMAWIDDYCRANPLKDVSEATVALIRELGWRR
jgi:hypothetical protein